MIRIGGDSLLRFAFTFSPVRLGANFRWVLPCAVSEDGLRRFAVFAPVLVKSKSAVLNRVDECCFLTNSTPSGRRPPCCVGVSTTGIRLRPASRHVSHPVSLSPGSILHNWFHTALLVSYCIVDSILHDCPCSLPAELSNPRHVL